MRSSVHDVMDPAVHSLCAPLRGAANGVTTRPAAGQLQQWATASGY